MIKEAILSLIPLCSPDVPPDIIAKIMQVESAGNPLAINVSGVNKKFKAKNQAEAVEIVKEYIKKGHTVDVGLMQVNSSNFAKLGYSNRIGDLFDVCNNINAGAEVLKDFYRISSKIYKDEKLALRAAISAYNTGDFKKGIKNGYVRKIYSTKSPFESKNEARIIVNNNSPKYQKTQLSQSDNLLRQALKAPTAVNIDILLKPTLIVKNRTEDENSKLQ